MSKHHLAANDGPPAHPAAAGTEVLVRGRHQGKTASVRAAELIGRLDGPRYPAIVSARHRAVYGRATEPRVARTRSRGMVRRPVLVAAAVFAVLLTAGAGTAGAQPKSVSIVVDGEMEHVWTMSGTVAGALSAAGISPGAHDVLAPSADVPIANGSTIVLDRGRLLTLTVDGDSRRVWTTARTVEQAVQLLAVRGADGSADLVWSANRSRPIPLDGLAVSAVTTHQVSITVGGKPATQVNSMAITVQGLLNEQRITLGALDTVSPALTTPLGAGLKVIVDRVSESEVSAQVALRQLPDVRVPDPDLDRGRTKTVRTGHAGVELVSVTIVRRNGLVESRVKTGTRTVTAPAATVIHVGNRVPAPTSLAAAEAAAAKFTYAGVEVFTHDTTFGVNWDGLAMCESTHNPKAVNAHPSAGLPTYGMFQFDLPTWASVGGSGNPVDASPTEQLMRAKILYSQRNLSPWACAYAAR